MKVALVCDWLTNIGGAERVLKSLSDLFPSAPIYTSQYNPKKIDWFKDKNVQVGWLQIFPSSFRRLLGPLRQWYFSHLNLSEYDLIISVTGAEAKGIKKGNARHVCYCHVPTQYYWGMKDDYLKNPGFGLLNPLARLGLKLLLPPLKSADFRAAQKPDEFITISTYSAGEIKKSYNRDATIIFPPVAVEKFSTSDFSTTKREIKTAKRQPNTPEKPERRGYITTSRQVNWKRLDLAIEACLALKVPLTVIGEGPEHKKLKQLAKKSHLIKFVPLVSQDELVSYLTSAKGYIFPSLEPFGIAPVEALAAGCPVIAYGNGGALDYVIDGENGVLFGKQSVNSLRQALKRFESLSFDETTVKASALPFSETRFREKILAHLSGKPQKTPSAPAPKPKPIVKKPVSKPVVKSAPVAKPTSTPAPKPTQKPVAKSTPVTKPAPRSIDIAPPRQKRNINQKKVKPKGTINHEKVKPKGTTTQKPSQPGTQIKIN
ncbi:glycosyltransferase [Candidatus Saccharibacteria bacterium]|nr:glycosyltransferase [Candidatus Saccharibacteria bacterium]